MLRSSSWRSGSGRWCSFARFWMRDDGVDALDQGRFVRRVVRPIDEVGGMMDCGQHAVGHPVDEADQEERGAHGRVADLQLGMRLAGSSAASGPAAFDKAGYGLSFYSSALTPELLQSAGLPAGRPRAR